MKRLTETDRRYWAALSKLDDLDNREARLLDSLVTAYRRKDRQGVWNYAAKIDYVRRQIAEVEIAGRVEVIR